MESFTELGREFHPSFRDMKEIVMNYLAESRGKGVSLGNVCSCVIFHPPCALYASLRSFYRSWSREKRKEKSGTRDKRRRSLFSLVRKDCPSSISSFLHFPSGSWKIIVLSSAYTSFLIASHINPVLIARITCDDRAAIFDKGKKPPSFASLSSFFFLWHGIIEPVANASNTREA